MKKILKAMYELLGLFTETLVSLVSVLLFSSMKAGKFFRIEKKKRTGNEQCYILGNGSSLNQYLANAEKDKQNVFVVNFFGSTDRFVELKPDKYIVLDNILIGRADYEYPVEKVKKLYEDLQKVDWPMTFYYPSNGDMNIIRRLKVNRNISVIVYNMTPVSGLKPIRHWLYRKSLGMPLPQNISNAAIFCALNSGFKKIYLYGMEHSWMKYFDVDPETHRIFMNDEHFYQKENIRWFNKGEYKWWLMAIYKAMNSHFMLREYADSIGAKIINKTDQSFVEAYEFDDY